MLVELVEVLGLHFGLEFLVDVVWARLRLKYFQEIIDRIHLINEP